MTSPEFRRRVLKVATTDDPAYVDVTYDPGDFTQATVRVRREVAEAKDQTDLWATIGAHSANASILDGDHD
jgi:hypothetical protein